MNAIQTDENNFLNSLAVLLINARIRQYGWNIKFLRKIASCININPTES